MGNMIQNNEKYLKETFKQFDKNGDGKISREELKDILYGDGANLTADQEIDEIIKQADADGDGEIDYNELMKLMKTLD